MNPIEKVTDPSFTESSKGLMTLFCIGVIHLVIGVDLTDAKIAIPWFPTIIFEHPERLTFLFWGLVVYSTYRYILHHAVYFRKLRFESLYSGLEKPRGRTFIESNILSENIVYRLKTKTKTIDESHSISLEAYGWDGPEHDQREVNVFAFDIVFSSDYRFICIEASEDEDVPLEKACFDNEKEMKRWGLQSFRDGEFGELTIYKSVGIPWLGHKVPLLLLSLPSYGKAIGSQKHIFDLILPLILNCLLAIASLVSS